MNEKATEPVPNFYRISEFYLSARHEDSPATKAMPQRRCLSAIIGTDSNIASLPTMRFNVSSVFREKRVESLGVRASTSLLRSKPAMPKVTAAKRGLRDGSVWLCGRTFNGSSDNAASVAFLICSSVASNPKVMLWHYGEYEHGNLEV